MKKILLCLVVLTTLCACGSPSSNVIVEEFVGKNVSDVYAWCGTLEDPYSCDVVYEDNDSYDKDIVFEQSVKAGNKLKDNVITFKVSSGYEPEVIMPFITPEVTLSDIEVWKEAVGVTNVTYTFEANDTVEKNHVIRLEPATHVYKDTPVVVYISSGPAEPENSDIEVKYGDYINLTVAQFEAKAKELGLKPNHQESRDKYDANVTIGNIVWHGSGIYVKDETFNYGVCINAITITPGQYVGKSEDEFIKIAKNTKLNPVHIDARDSYSTKIAKGYVVTHGYGVYVENEDFKYGLSKGPAKIEQGYEGSTEENFLAYLEMLGLKGDRKAINSTTISAGRIVSYNYGNYSTGDAVTYYVSIGPENTDVYVPSFTGTDEADFLRFLNANGLAAGTRTEAASDLTRGKVISNDTGTFKKGSKVNYVVSNENASMIMMDSFDSLYQMVTYVGDYEHAEYVMEKYLFGKCFTNYTVQGAMYANYEPGILLKVYVDGVEHVKEEPVRQDAEIIVYISNYLQ